MQHEDLRRRARPSVSIVAPCYNEAEVLQEFHRRVARSAREIAGLNYELVLVDDGSKDGTWEIIRSLAARDPGVVGVRLMRNHGHQAAATAGLALSRGERVLLIDADLQDPPELLGPMMKAMDEGAEVVFGQRASRKAETWFKKASASLFYRLLAKLAATNIPRDTGDFRLMSRRVVDALAMMPERQRFIRGMVSWIGGNQVAIAYDREARFAGTSKYPFRHMLRFAIDAITSFSATPLRLATYLGFATVLVSLALLIFTLWSWASGQTIVGWSSVMTAVVLFSAVQLIVLGIMGEYIGRLFQEVKSRPTFLVDHIIAENRSHDIPVEFCSLPPTARRDMLEDIRSCKVIDARSSQVAE